MRHRPLKNQQQQQQQQTKEPLLVDLSCSTQSSSKPTNESYRDKDIMEKLQRCRLDRERLSVLNSAIKSTLPGLEDQLLEKVLF